MPVGSELAALFEARRLKAAESADNSENEIDATDNDAPSSDNNNGTSSNSPGPLAPHGYPEGGGTQTRPLTVGASSSVRGRITTTHESSSSKNTPATPVRTAPNDPVIHGTINAARTEPSSSTIAASSASQGTSKEGDGVSDGENPPTPAFLLNARKNLKSAKAPNNAGAEGERGDGEAEATKSSLSDNPFKKNDIGKLNASGKQSNGVGISGSMGSVARLTNNYNDHAGQRNTTNPVNLNSIASNISENPFKNQNKFVKKTSSLQSTDSSPSAAANDALQSSNSQSSTPSHPKSIPMHPINIKPRLASSSSIASEEAPLDETHSVQNVSAVSITSNKIATSSNTANANHARKSMSCSTTPNDDSNEPSNDIKATTTKTGSASTIPSKNSIMTSANVRRRAARTNSNQSISSQNSQPNLSASVSSDTAATDSNSTAGEASKPRSNTGKPSNPTPNYLRRERLMAKVMSSRGSNNSRNKSTSEKPSNPQNIDDQSEQFDSAKITVTSPRADEVEMMFADESFPKPTGGDVPDDASIDSISNELYGIPSTSTGSAATIPTNNIQNPQHSHNDVNVSFSSVDTAPVNSGLNKNAKVQVYATPEKSKSHMSQQQRLQNASTPKIRGNYQHRRDKEFGDPGSFEDEDEVPMQPMQSPTSQRQNNNQQQHTWSPERRPQHQLYDHHEDEDMPQDEYYGSNGGSKHNIHEAYSLRERAPSTISQVSGLSMPSCFPAEQSSSLGHLQQPVLAGSNPSGTTGVIGQCESDFEGVGGGGGAIHTSSSFGNTSATSGLSGIGGPNIASTPISMSGGIGSSAFSPGVEAENRRLRDQLSVMQRKLDEKDAIISQLMKRIADLESSYSSAGPGISNASPRGRTITTQSPGGGGNVNNSSTYHQQHSEGHGRTGSPYSDSFSMNALWEQSRPAFSTNGGSEMFTNFPARSPSVDTESAISISSSPNLSGHQHLTSSRGGRMHMKQSPNTTTTASTASITSSSSKSRDMHQSHSRQSRQTNSRRGKDKQQNRSSSSKKQASSRQRSKSLDKRSPSGRPSEGGNDRVFVC